jgi:hypothetical protein
MASRGLTPPDSTYYGFYSVRLKESLRSGLPLDSLVSDSLLIDSGAEEQDGILQQLFGKKRIDSLQVKEAPKPKNIPRDSVIIRTPSTRKDKREQRKLERDSKIKKGN